MPRPHRFVSRTLRYAYDRYVGHDPELRTAFEEALVGSELAMALYRLRTDAGLTQASLAKRVGTTASVISRLEGADYRGHSLSMLRRIAEALGRRIEIRLAPIDAPRRGRRHPPRPAA